jgi:putative membrane protein
MHHILTHPIQSLISILLAGVAVLLASMVVPGFKIRGGFKTAVLVGVVYGFLKLLFKIPLLILAWPALLLGGFLAFFAANALLLWVTDKLLEDFELESTSALLLGTLALSLIDIFLLGGSAFF